VEDIIWSIWVEVITNEKVKLMEMSFFLWKFTSFNIKKRSTKSILWIRVVFLCHVRCKAVAFKARSCHHVNLGWPLLHKDDHYNLFKLLQNSKLKLQSSNLIQVNKVYSCYFLPIPKSSLLKPFSSKLMNIHSKLLRQVAICKIFEFGRF